MVKQDIALGSKHLLELNAASDAIQLTADKLMNTRHFANTLFNIMRGGIFDDGYQIEKWDFVKYLETANKKVFKKKEALVENLPDMFSLSDLKDLARKDDDKNFKRLALNTCLLNLVEGTATQVDPGTSFLSIRQMKLMVQRY